MGLEHLTDLGERAIFFVMGIASITGLAVVMNRLIYFTKKEGKKNHLEQLLISLRSGDRDRIQESLTESNMYTSFVQYCLERYSMNPDGIKETMQGRVIEEKIKLEKLLSVLGTLGNNAPFIGLLGTVLGVIKAFYNLGTLGNSGAEVVMKGISIALLATAAGLFIAIPVVMANNYFSRRMKVILQNFDIITCELLALFAKKKNRRAVHKDSSRDDLRDKRNINPHDISQE